MTRSWWAWVRVLGGAGILAVLLWRLGSGPFLDGLRLIDGRALAAALAIGVLTTVSCAWRWHLVAHGLGVRLSLPTAVAHYYRSVFLNATLPGGVVGDVHRAVSHGRDVSDVSRGVRAVVWERTAGQVVQILIAVAVLLAFPSPVRTYLPFAFGVVLLGVLIAVPLNRKARDGASRLARAWRTAGADVRDGLRRNWIGVLVASVLAVVGHLATFMVAARTVGSIAPLSRLVPLTLLALLVMALPLNVAGFGPREGVAAWAFASAGLTAAEGLATALVYGALVLVGSLPGAAVLVAQRFRARAATPVRPPDGGDPDRGDHCGQDDAGDDSHPGDGAAAVRRRVRHGRPGVHLRRPGRRPRAPRVRARRLGFGAGAAGTPAQRMPDRRRVRQPAV